MGVEAAEDSTHLGGCLFGLSELLELFSFREFFTDVGIFEAMDAVAAIHQR